MDLYSDLIGKGLLSGETMLAEHCKECGCPLMKSKKIGIYCVKCGPLDVGGSVKPKKAIDQVVVEPISETKRIEKRPAPEMIEKRPAGISIISDMVTQEVCFHLLILEVENDSKLSSR
jgi:uncharacterized Zn finger protein (UPF0148 family)